MAQVNQQLPPTQVTEHERATFITQLYKLLQQIVQLGRNIIPDEALLLKLGNQCKNAELAVRKGKTHAFFWRDFQMKTIFFTKIGSGQT